MEPIDTLRPLDIVAEEELERVSAMLQRDNLVRGLGLVDAVYRLLHSTPGTTGLIKGATTQPSNQNNSNLSQFNPISHHLSDALTAKNQPKEFLNHPIKLNLPSLPFLSNRDISRADYAVNGGGISGCCGANDGGGDQDGDIHFDNWDRHRRPTSWRPGYGDFAVDVCQDKTTLLGQRKLLQRQYCQEMPALQNESAQKEKFPETLKPNVICPTFRIPLPPVKVADISGGYGRSLPKPESYFVISGLKLNLGER